MTLQIINNMNKGINYLTAASILAGFSLEIQLFYEIAIGLLLSGAMLHYIGINK